MFFSCATRPTASATRALLVDSILRAKPSPRAILGVISGRPRSAGCAGESMPRLFSQARTDGGWRERSPHRGRYCRRENPGQGFNTSQGGNQRDIMGEIFLEQGMVASPDRYSVRRAAPA